MINILISKAIEKESFQSVLSHFLGEDITLFTSWDDFTDTEGSWGFFIDLKEDCYFLNPGEEVYPLMLAMYVYSAHVPEQNVAAYISTMYDCSCLITDDSYNPFSMNYIKKDVCKIVYAFTKSDQDDADAETP